MPQPAQIAFWLAAVAYSGVLTFWLWAAFSWLNHVKGLPATKDICDTLSNFMLNKVLLGVVFGTPVGAFFGLVKTLKG